MKRFYKEVLVGEADAGGYVILLDGRKVKTPARVALRLPRKAQADLVAAEWAAQPEKIDPAAMVVTKCANTAMDKAAENRADFEKAALIYLNDLLCYRAVSPKELVAQQTENWDPVLDWFAERFSARLKVGQGLVPVVQDSEVVAAVQSHISTLDAFALVALAGMADLLGSLVLAAAVAEGQLSAEEAYTLSRTEENYQMKMWGRDAEAVKIAEARGAEVSALGAFLRASIAGSVC